MVTLIFKIMPLAFQHSVMLLDIEQTPQNLKLTLGILPSCCEEEILDLMDLFRLFDTSEQKIMRSILKQIQGNSRKRPPLMSGLGGHLQEVVT